MGVIGLEDAFDALDPSRKGAIGVNELYTFDCSLNFSPLSREQIRASIKQICGEDAQEMVQKKYFEQVTEIERYHSVMCMYSTPNTSIAYPQRIGECSARCHVSSTHYIYVIYIYLHLP